MKNFQNKTKIAKVSGILRIILFAATVLWGIGVPMLLFRIFTKTPAVTGLTRFALQSSCLLGVISEFVVIFCLFRFFNRLKQGRLFDAQTVGNLGMAGKWWILSWIFGLLNYETRLRAGFEVFPSPDDWVSNVSGLVAGLSLIFMAWLLKEAEELQEEQELTV
jgi:hypothetical protein